MYESDKRTHNYDEEQSSDGDGNSTNNHNHGEKQGANVDGNSTKKQR